MSQISRVAFFGSPDFALPSLQALAASRFPPTVVISQPARRVGRGRQIVDPPVAAWGKREGFEVWQPERVRDPAFIERFKSGEFSAAVVVAFGQIFPRALLALPKVGCINLHASLLPKFRGAAPIQAAIASGEETTGVCTMRMEAGLDTGPVYLRREVAIGESETAPELSQRLAVLGAALLPETLEGLEDGSLEAVDQDDSLATYAPRLCREDGAIDWLMTSAEIVRRGRAFDPWPGLHSVCAGLPLKVLAVRSGDDSTDAQPGVVVRADDVLEVACGGGSRLALLSVQRPGRNPVTAGEFLRSEPLALGESLAGLSQ